MSQYFEVHPDNPQPRLLKQAAQILHGGGVVAIPTDSSYALVCHLDDKAAVETITQVLQMGPERKIDAIKQVRAATNCSLRDAKEWVETLRYR